jgi:Kelch motif
LNKIESSLIEELNHCKELLDNKRMIYGQWSVFNHQGSLPHSREGASAAIVDNNFYIFGGFSRDLFGDFRVYDINQGHWKIIPD